MGLRPPHYSFVLENRPKVDWFEVVTDNFLDTEGRPIRILEAVRKDYPVVFHGVSMSIGSTDPLNLNYLKKVRSLIDRFDPAIVSDHLCWTGVHGVNLHDLLPLPHNEETLRHVVGRVREVQDILGRRILLENASTYVGFEASEMPEWEFLAALANRADCGILLDVNNVYVNAFNHGWNAKEYLSGIPVQRVGQFHLAGHSNRGSFLFDTHDGPVIDPVWNLYEEALRRFGPVSTLIEWDAQIPEFPILHAEARRAAERMKHVA